MINHKACIKSTVAEQLLCVEHSSMKASTSVWMVLLCSVAVWLKLVEAEALTGSGAPPVRLPVAYRADMIVSVNHGANVTTAVGIGSGSCVAQAVRMQQSFSGLQTDVLSSFVANTTFTRLLVNDSQVACSHVPLGRAMLHGGVIFPNMEYINASATALVPCPGNTSLSCYRYNGSTCLFLDGLLLWGNAANTTSICGAFVFWQTVGAQQSIPVAFQASSLAVTAYIMWANVSLNISAEDFILPSSVTCPAAETCNASCPIPRIVSVYDSIQLCNAPLLPTWILAVVVGLAGAYTIVKKVGCFLGVARIHLLICYSM